MDEPTIKLEFAGVAKAVHLYPSDYTSWRFDEILRNAERAQKARLNREMILVHREADLQVVVAFVTDVSLDTARKRLGYSSLT